jgi:hypothetical protein
VENKETVFVTQQFDGKQIKNTYHYELSPENYFKLEKLRRKLNFKTIDQVINYLFVKWGHK